MNDNQAQETVTTFAFTLSFKVGGVVDSTLSLEETLSKLHAELSDFYGDDGYEILDFHAATEEEVDAYHTFMALSDEDDVTIN